MIVEYFSVRCDCRCGLDCRGQTPIATSVETARAEAHTRGWIQGRSNGRLVDVCSTCKDGHRRRPRAPWQKAAT